MIFRRNSPFGGDGHFYLLGSLTGRLAGASSI
jgi:hypothetical protein